jgi:hypothetical protein
MSKKRYYRLYYNSWKGLAYGNEKRSNGANAFK